MDKPIRGIECTLEEDAIESLLQYIAENNTSFVVPYCMLNGEGIKTENMHGIWTPRWLNRLAQESILELVLHVYPPNALPCKIETYADFMESECRMCLIYYDCGMLEMYIKNHEDFSRIWNELMLLNAQDMVIKTDYNDKRYRLD